MEFLGIGAPELVFILIIVLILLGPRDMQKAGRTIGIWLNNLVRSEWWRAFRRTSDELRRLPTNLMREANREMMDMERDLRDKLEPIVIAGPRSSLSSTPSKAASPPNQQVQTEPGISNPPSDDLTTESTPGDPPDAPVDPEKKPLKPPDL